MAKAIKLKLQPEFDFTLIGIASTEPLYKMSWLINEALNINLAEHTPVKFYHQKLNEWQRFDRFMHQTDDLCIELIKNKGKNGLWLEEFKQLDYVLRITCEADQKNWLKAIKDIKNISLALTLEPGLIKNKDRLFYTEEEN